MKKVICLISLCALAACALPAAKSSNQSFLVGGREANAATSDQIEKDLTRESNQYGYYFASAYPMTDPLIRAEEAEAAKKEMSTPEETAARVEKEVTHLTKDKTCFMVKLYGSSIGDAQFKFWKGKFEVDGKIMEAHYDNINGVESVPTTVDPGFAGHGYDWFNVSYLCGPKIDLTKTIKVHLIPTFKDAPVATLQWTQQMSGARASN